MSKKSNKNKMCVTAELRDGKGYIRIVDVIHEWTASSSGTIRAEVDKLLAQGVTECDVYVSTRGGDVFEASEIVNELKRFAKVNIMCGAIVASAGTYILAKFNSTVRRNTQVMVHKPILFAQGNLEEVLAQLKLLRNLTEEYKNAYAKKTGKTPEAIEKMWSKGDYWMTGVEAFNEGFVDALEEEEMEITEEDVAILQACAAPIIPTITATTKTPNKNSEQMDKATIRAALGLAADATDAQVEAALKEAKKAKDALAQTQANAQNAAKVKAEALVDGAITAKKITAEKRDQFVKLATADYDSAKEVLDGMQPVPQLSAGLKTGTPAGEVTAERKGWTLDDYLDKAPEAYAQMKEENPEEAKRLESEYFKKK